MGAYKLREFVRSGVKHRTSLVYCLIGIVILNQSSFTVEAGRTMEIHSLQLILMFIRPIRCIISHYILSPYPLQKSPQARVYLPPSYTKSTEQKEEKTPTPLEHMQFSTPTPPMYIDPPLKSTPLNLSTPMIVSPISPQLPTVHVFLHTHITLKPT